MKRSHVVLLVMTIVLTLCSAYSLAALNQTYYFDIEWFSQYNNCFSKAERSYVQDKWSLSSFPESLKLKLIRNSIELEDVGLNEGLITGEAGFFSRNLLVYVGFDKCSSIEYRMRVMEMAQRGNNLEVKVCMNSPDSTTVDLDDSNNKKVYDLVKIDKGQLTQKGSIEVTFKNQYGQRISSSSINIE
jgi:hypothetical protein